MKWQLQERSVAMILDVYLGVGREVGLETVRAMAVQRNHEKWCLSWE